MRQRILFISEAVTLAHVARPLALAQSLDPSRYEVHFASAYWSETLFNNTSLTYLPIESISYEAFIQSVGGGDSAYTDALLEMYLWEEDSLYRDIRPDLVVSDARLSTCVSAPAAGIPLVNINNAYWSPYRKDPLNPVPEYTRSTLYNRFPPRLAPILFPYPVVKFIFPFLQRIYQNRYLAPFNRALKQRGLPAFSDFESFYTFGNWTLYCETPELIPLEGAPSHHRYIGPLLWSPPRSSPLPKIDHTVPTIYVSFGSSNEVPHCREIIERLSTMNLRLLVATAGRFDFPSSERVHVADFLPGSEACRQADLVVCSGGSTAAYQALFEGTPVLGIPSNADQHLAMGSIERNGAGLSIRSDHATPQNVSEAVNRLLSAPSFKIQARRFSKNFQSYDARQRFQDFVKEILPLASPEPARPGSPQVLPERLRRVAEEAPDKPAFWGLVERQRGQSPLTYGQVWARVQSLALGLLEKGLQKGERVGFLAGVTPEWELLHQAVLLAGGVVVGLDLHEAPERVLGAARESNIRGWVVQNDQVIKEWPALWSAPPRFIVCLDTPDPAQVAAPTLSFRELLTRHQGIPFELPFPSPDNLATLIFTSGTTGEPRGVAYTHAQLVHAVRSIARAYRQLPKGFDAVCWLPLSNLFQRIVNLSCIERMSAITFVPHPRDLIESLPLIRPNILIGVPRFFEKLESGIRKTVSEQSRLRRAVFHFTLGCRSLYERWRLNKKAGRFFLRPLVPVLDGVAARRVRQSLGGKLAFLVSGSAPLNEATFRFFSGLGVPILEAYGTSENAIPIALNRPDAFCPGTVGRPLAPNDVRLSEDGEVLVKGPGVFSGYWNKPRDPALFQGAYLRTGDEGHWVGAGFLKLTGRRSDIIKTSTGRRLAPGPLEEKFKEIPFVDQAVIVGNGRKGPVLILSLKKGISAEGGARRVSDILKEKARLLPLLSQPVGILVLNRPFSIHQGELTANLKLRRRAIESSFAAVLDKLCASAESPSPAGPVIWAAGPGGGQGDS